MTVLMGHQPIGLRLRIQSVLQYEETWCFPSWSDNPSPPTKAVMRWVGKDVSLIGVGIREANARLLHM